MSTVILCLSCSTEMLLGKNLMCPICFEPLCEKCAAPPFELCPDCHAIVDPAITEAYKQKDQKRQAEGMPSIQTMYLEYLKMIPELARLGAKYGSKSTEVLQFMLAEAEKYSQPITKEKVQCPTTSLLGIDRSSEPPSTNTTPSDDA